jgi:hypothetical protein
VRNVIAACLVALAVASVAPASGAELRHISSRLFEGEASDDINWEAVGFPYHHLTTNGKGVFLTCFTNGSMSFGGTLVGPGPVAARFEAADAPAIWGRVLYTVTSGSFVNITTAALAADGSVVLAGAMYGTVDFGGGEMTSFNGTSDAFVVKLNPDGSVAWQHRYGTQFSQVINEVVLADNGDLLVIGSNMGQMDFGGGGFISSGAADVVVARLGPDGTHLWSHQYGQSGTQEGYAIATAPHGKIVLLCNLGTGGINFGGGLLVRSGGNIVLTVLNGDGNYVSARTIGGSGGANPTDMAVDKNGNVFICGTFVRSMDRGDGTLLIAPPTAASSGFLAAFDSSGTYRWSYALLDTLRARALAVGTSNRNECVMAGWTKTAPQIANFDIPDCRFFTMVFDSTGGVEDARGFGAPSVFLPVEYMCMRDDDLYLAGGTASAIDFGGGWLYPAPPSDIFLTHLAMRRPPQVTITDFTARARATGVELRWNVTSGEPLAKYYLSRRMPGSSHSTLIYYAPAAGAATSFTDDATEPGHSYDYDLTVETTLGDPVTRSTSIDVPAIKSTLGQNSPNPFNPITTFPYTLAAPANVSIAVYDLSGALIARIEQGMQPAGRHEAKWAGHNGEGNLVSSGVYFYRLEGAGDIPARKMVLLK